MGSIRGIHVLASASPLESMILRAGFPMHKAKTLSVSGNRTEMHGVSFLWGSRFASTRRASSSPAPHTCGLSTRTPVFPLKIAHLSLCYLCRRRFGPANPEPTAEQEEPHG